MFWSIEEKENAAIFFKYGKVFHVIRNFQLVSDQGSQKIDIIYPFSHLN